MMTIDSQSRTLKFNIPGRPNVEHFILCTVVWSAIIDSVKALIGASGELARK